MNRTVGVVPEVAICLDGAMQGSPDMLALHATAIDGRFGYRQGLRTSRVVLDRDAHASNGNIHHGLLHCNQDLTVALVNLNDGTALLRVQKLLHDFL